MIAEANTTEAQSKLEALVTAFRTRAFLQQDLTALDEYLTPDFIDHFAPPWDPPGVEGVRRRFSQAAHAFKTTNVEIVHSMSQGNVLMQAIRIHMRHDGEFMGHPPSGREFWIAGFDAFQVRDGKLAAHWGCYDVSRIPDLLGFGPPMPAADAKGASWSQMWEH
jgi:predicted SnoaL-like aldol condensation-catalyzing enzyme